MTIHKQKTIHYGIIPNSDPKKATPMYEPFPLDIWAVERREEEKKKRRREEEEKKKQKRDGPVREREKKGQKKDRIERKWLKHKNKKIMKKLRSMKANVMSS